MSTYLDLIKLCPEIISKKAVESGNLELIQTLINDNLFIFNKDAKIGNLATLKLLNENKYLEDSKININDFMHNVEIVKYLLEEAKIKVHYPNFIRYIINHSDSDELLKYILTYDINITKPFQQTGYDSCIYWACQNSKLNFVKILANLPEYDDISNLERDLDNVSMKNVEIAQYLIEEEGLNKNVIKENWASDEVKAYLKNDNYTKRQHYFGIESFIKLDISFPGIIQIKRNRKIYYYVFPFVVGDTADIIKNKVDSISAIGSNPQIYLL